MPTISGNETIYDILDRYLEDDWDRAVGFGRLQDMTFANLLGMYKAVTEVHLPAKPHEANQLALYLGKEPELDVILCSLLHVHKLVMEYPIRPAFLRRRPGYHTTIYDFNVLLDETDEDSGTSPYPSKTILPTESALPTKSELIALFIQTYLPKLASVRYLVEHELLEFVNQPSPSLLDEGRHAVRGCVENSYEFCKDLYAVLRGIDSNIPPVPSKTNWHDVMGPWVAVSGDLDKHLLVLRELIKATVTSRERSQVLLCTDDPSHQIAQLLMTYFAEITDRPALLGGYAVRPRPTPAPEDRHILNRFLEQKLLATWTSLQGLPVATVVEIRRQEKAFEAWLAEISKMLPQIKACRQLSQCEEAIKDLQDALQARQQEILAKLKGYRTKLIRQAVQSGFTTAVLMFLGTFYLTERFRESLIASGLNALATVGRELAKQPWNIDQYLEGADLVYAKLALNRNY